MYFKLKASLYCYRNPLPSNTQLFQFETEYFWLQCAFKTLKAWFKPRPTALNPCQYIHPKSGQGLALRLSLLFWGQRTLSSHRAWQGQTQDSTTSLSLALVTFRPPQQHHSWVSKLATQCNFSVWYKIDHLWSPSLLEADTGSAKQNKSIVDGC